MEDIMNKDIVNNIINSNLIWDDYKNLPMSFYEGAYLGNGRMGIAVYLQENPLRIHVELGRNDVYDRREHEPYWNEALFTSPRLPIGAMSYRIDGALQKFNMELNIYDGILHIYYKTELEEVELELYTLSNKNIIGIEQKKGDFSKWIHTPAIAISYRQIYALLHNDEMRFNRNYKENDCSFLKKENNVNYCIQPLQN